MDAMEARPQRAIPGRHARICRQKFLQDDKQPFMVTGNISIKSMP